MRHRNVRIKLRKSGKVIAEGPIGWGITPFEGNYYVRADGTKIQSLGWMYWLPNPLLPFIWYRIAVPKNHPELTYEEIWSS